MPVRSCAQCTAVRVPKYEQHTQVDVRETRKTEVFIYFTFYGLKQRIPVLGILVGKTTVPYIYRTFSHLILQHNNRVLTGFLGGADMEDREVSDGRGKVCERGTYGYGLVHRHQV